MIKLDTQNNLMLLKNDPHSDSCHPYTAPGRFGWCHTDDTEDDDDNDDYDDDYDYSDHNVESWGYCSYHCFMETTIFGNKLMKTELQ